ncbi:MAG: tetratricopeptide repeat-containing glycosyltransferase family protein [bacterium]|nr:tetratricopeptide repeat-containing glycosyltransferase family protein [bacterium]
MNSSDRELQQGWHLHQQKRYPQAESVYRKVLENDRSNANAWCYLGMSLHDQKRFAEAVEAYRNALAINPKFPIAFNNLGNSLRYVGDIEEADQCFQKAVDLKPDYLNAYKNRGTLHVWTGDLERGLRYYQQALQINSQEPELHRNLGVIYLLQGRFAEGWEEYRWRWRVGDLVRPTTEVPVWGGQDVRGKRILLSAEQGLGDTLNFVRFAKSLRELGARTTVYCQPRLLALLQLSGDQFGEILPNNLSFDPGRFDWQCSLLDVPDVLKMDADKIPHASPYLRAAENLESYWQSRLPKVAGQFRVGVCWQGNPDHQADSFRSIPLRCFETLAEVPGVRLISLQSGFGCEQIQDWKGCQPLEQLPSNTDQSSGAFMDTAAIMRQLDLVITSDTAVAHLAGALGIKVWIVLSYVPDWRWLLNREDTPWYSHARLFRQRQLGDWPEVFKRLRHALSQEIASAGSTPIEEAS